MTEEEKEDGEDTDIFRIIKLCGIVVIALFMVVIGFSNFARDWRNGPRQSPIFPGLPTEARVAAAESAAASVSAYQLHMGLSLAAGIVGTVVGAVAVRRIRRGIVGGIPLRDSNPPRDVAKTFPRLPPPSGPAAVDWDSSETYKGEPPVRLPDWLARTFNGLMIFLLLAMVFCICGILAFLAFYRVPGAASLALHDTGLSAWARFAVGGLLGSGWLAYRLRRKQSGF